MEKPTVSLHDIHPHHAEKTVGGHHQTRIHPPILGRPRKCLRLEERFDMATCRPRATSLRSGSPAKFWNALPPKRLVLSWADPDDLADKSRVTFEIEAMEDMVCLTVTHGKFKAGSTMVGKVSGGWPRVLSSMKSFLETGKGLNVFGGR